MGILPCESKWRQIRKKSHEEAVNGARSHRAFVAFSASSKPLVCLLPVHLTNPKPTQHRFAALRHFTWSQGISWKWWNSFMGNFLSIELDCHEIPVHLKYAASGRKNGARQIIFTWFKGLNQERQKWWNTEPSLLKPLATKPLDGINDVLPSSRQTALSEHRYLCRKSRMHCTSWLNCSSLFCWDYWQNAFSAVSSLPQPDFSVASERVTPEQWQNLR